MKIRYCILLFFLTAQSLFAQERKADFWKTLAATASVDFGRHTSLGAGIALIIADQRGYWGYDISDAPNVYSNWILVAKENIWLNRFNGSPVSAHQFAIEYHLFNPVNARFFDWIPKTAKLNYFNLHADGHSEHVIAPELGISIIYGQLTYRRSFYLNKHSVLDGFVGQNALVLTMAYPFSLKGRRKII
jgi:hypothetical protein